MRKFILWILLLLIIVFSSGCSDLLDRNNTDSIDTPVLPGDTAEQKPFTCIVYFQLEDQDYLVGQQHLVSVPETKRLEEIIIQELIYGPKVKSLSLKPVINPNTTIVSISDNNSLLFVTLSSHFLEPLAGAPANWADDPIWVDAVMKQRRLAVSALVNALTQTGKYSKLQLYIDYDDSGQGQRPTREEVGFIDENSSQLLEPIGRNSSVIYGPETALVQFLTHFSEKSWQQAVDFVELNDQDADANDLSSEFSILDLTIIDYQITSTTTSYDGKSAVLTIDYYIKAKDSVEYQNSNVSLLVLLVDDIWKVSNISVNQLLKVSNG
ncbi:MAG: GerMN domain-containing protein [Clostridiales bacterium]|nr:GerMN domain-containing protein [Clostridiales bacterium]